MSFLENVGAMVMGFLAILVLGVFISIIAHNLDTKRKIHIKCICGEEFGLPTEGVLLYYRDEYPVYSKTKYPTPFMTNLKFRKHRMKCEG